MASLGLPPVSAVMVIENTDLAQVKDTLDALLSQNYPISEVVIVDISAEPVAVTSSETEVEVIHAPSAGVTDAQARGVEQASGTYILQQPADAPPLRVDYVAEAVRRLQAEGVVAAGGVPSFEGQTAYGGVATFLQRLAPLSRYTRNLVYPRAAIAPDRTDEAFPPMSSSASASLRSVLREQGQIERMPRQPISLRFQPPENRLLQELSPGAIIGGVVAGLVTSTAERVIRRVGNQAAGEITA